MRLQKHSMLGDVITSALSVVSTFEAKMPDPPKISLESVADEVVEKAYRWNPSIDQSSSRQMALEFLESLAYPPQNVIDQHYYAHVLAEYLAFAATKPGVRPLSSFRDDFHSIPEYVNQVVSRSEMVDRLRYEGTGTIPGVEEIPLPKGYRALKITEYSDELSTGPLRDSRWLIRSPSAFKSYHIGPDNPAYIILRGNNLVVLIMLDEFWMVDPFNDDPTRSQFIEQDRDGIYEAVQALFAHEGKPLPAMGDFLSAFFPQFVRDGKFKMGSYEEILTEIQKMEDEDAEARNFNELPPHGTDKIEAANSGIQNVLLDWAPEILKLVSDGSPDDGLAWKIARDVRKQATHDLKKNPERARRNFEAIGQTAKKIVERGYMRIAWLRDFREILPRDYLQWVLSLDPTKIGLGLYNQAFDAIALQSTMHEEVVKDVPEEERNKALQHFYQKFFPEAYNKQSKKGRRPRPQRAGNIEVIRLTNKHLIWHGIACPMGTCVIEDDKGFWVLRDSKHILSLIRKTSELIEIKKKLEELAVRSGFSKMPSIEGAEEFVSRMGYKTPHVAIHWIIGSIFDSDQAGNELMYVRPGEVIVRILSMREPTLGQLVGPEYEQAMATLLDRLVHFGTMAWIKDDHPVTTAWLDHYFRAFS